MTLTENQKKHLRRLGHPLHPLVMVGNAIEEPGKLDAIVNELNGALQAHELVKVRAKVGDRESRDAIFATLAERTQSELVQRIGNVGVFFRLRTEKSRIVLPDA